MKIEVTSNLGEYGNYIEKAIRKMPRNISIVVKNPVPYSAAVEWGHTTRSGSWVNGVFMMEKATEEALPDLRFSYNQTLRKGFDPELWGSEFISGTKKVSFSTGLRLYNYTPKKTGLLSESWSVSIRTSR